MTKANRKKRLAETSRFFRLCMANYMPQAFDEKRNLRNRTKQKSGFKIKF